RSQARERPAEDGKIVEELLVALQFRERHPATDAAVHSTVQFANVTKRDDGRIRVDSPLVVAEEIRAAAEVVEPPARPPRGVDRLAERRRTEELEVRQDHHRRAFPLIAAGSSSIRPVTSSACGGDRTPAPGEWAANGRGTRPRRKR